MPTPRPVLRFPVALLVGAGVVLAGERAHANGRPLRTVSVHIRPDHPNDILIAATIGMVISHDGGASWRWMCEQAIGYGGTWDPDYLYTPSGRIFATTFDSLQILTDDECGFAPGNTVGIQFSQVAQASTGLILGSAVEPSDSRLYRSIDNGDTFTPYLDPAPGAWWNSLEFAPSDASRVYLSGYVFDKGGNKALLLFRSVDGGDSFQPLSVAGFASDEASAFEIAAISPTNPDVMLIRVTLFNGTIGDAVYLTTDGGDTFTKKLELDDETPGILIRPDGTMYVTQRTRELPSYVSTDGGDTFQVITVDAPTAVHCLQNAPDGGMYVCANYATPDFMALGHGTTYGTWTPAFAFEQMAGPVACAEGTTQHDVCQENVWCGLKTMYGITSDEISCTTEFPDAAPAGDDGGGDSAADPPSCCGAGTSPSGALLVGLATIVPLVARRRRRVA